MRFLRVWLILFVAAHGIVRPARAALNTQLVIEVRPTVGASTNGGGFWSGATGTDMTPFDNKNAAACTSCQSATINISTTDAVAVGTTTITSATANFSAAIVGNIVYFQGGTGAIAAVRRQVITFTNVTTIVLDAAIAASTGMTMNIGGALDDVSTALTFNTTSNDISIKDTGVLVRTADLAMNADLGQPPQYNLPPNRLFGYVTSRNETPSASKRAHIQLSTNAGLTAINGLPNGPNGWQIQNLDIDCNNLATSTGIRPWFAWMITNVKLSNCRSHHALMDNNIFSSISDSEISGNGNSCSSGISAGSATGGLVERNYVHGLGSGCVGIQFGQGISVLYNVVANNVFDGIAVENTAFVSTVVGNTLYANACGINMKDSLQAQNIIRNNIMVNNTTWGFCNAHAGNPAAPMWDGNAYFNNTSGTRQNMDDAGTTNKINGIAPYTNVLDVILTADPFTNAAGNNFTLNNTAGGGAALRGTATPGPLPGLSQTGFMDFGALQAQAAAGGGNSAYAQ